MPPSDPTIVLAVQALSKRFTLHETGTDIEAFRGVSLTVRAGAFSGLVGASGSGKSSILKCIYRRYLPTSGAVLFLDEVTTSLDLSVQAKILDLVLELHQRTRVSILLVTHDIGVARMLASHCIVMRYGQVVEAGLMDQILEDPQHAYTQELIGASL